MAFPFSMSEKILIRRAGTSDLEALLPLVRAYREFYERPADAERERAFMRGHLERGTSIVFVAQAGDALVGFTQLFPTYSTVRLAPALILEDLFVEPHRRGSGIATALLERAVAYARETVAAGMFLETAYDNVSAQRVYERNGWTREERFYKYNAPL